MKKAMDCECKNLEVRYGALTATVPSRTCLEREHLDGWIPHSGFNTGKLKIYNTVL